MHELAITQNILDICLRHAAEAQANKITDIYMVIGQLSSIVDDSVQFYWDFVSQGTIAEGARLHFRRIPAEILCKKCGNRYKLDGKTLVCPECGSDIISVIAGEDFTLEAIDIDMDNGESNAGEN